MENVGLSASYQIFMVEVVTAGYWVVGLFFWQYSSGIASCSLFTLMKSPLLHLSASSFGTKNLGHLSLMAVHPLAGLYAPALLVFVVLVVDLEVSELVAVLGAGHNAEPIPQVVLGQVLQVPLGEGGGGGQVDLVLLSDQSHLLAEVV